MKKRVLLLMTPHYSIYDVIRTNLEQMGYEVTFFDDQCQPFAYENWGERLTNFYQKTFLRNKGYKDLLRERFLEKEALRLLDYPENYFDYTLVIRPDNYTLGVVEHLRTISKQLFAYQFDGMFRFRDRSETIGLYDQFAVFDKGDFQQLSPQYPNLRLSHNFYFDIITPQNKDIDLLYIGAEQDDRVGILSHLHRLCNRGDFSTYFRLFSEKNETDNGLIYTEELMTYQEVLDTSSRAKTIIDIKFPEHNGLSFRFFEALHFSQKLITDNPYVTEFDFYHPDNILVVQDWYALDEGTLHRFLNTPYKELPEEVKERYSFHYWFESFVKG